MVNKSIASILIGLGMAQMYLQPNQINANEENSEFPCCEPTIVAGEPLNPCLINAGYPYPATISVCDGWDIYAKGEFIYWGAVPLNSFIGLEVSDDFQSTINLFHKSPYKPGFRVALGADLGSVVLDASWWRYHNNSTTHFFAAPNSAITTVVSGAVFPDLKTTLGMDFDYAVISLQKPAYMGKKLIVNLNYALFLEWTSQKWDITGTPFGSLEPGFVKAHNKHWGVGPKLGVVAQALLPYCFRGIASMDLALMYSQTRKTFTNTSFPSMPQLNHIAITKSGIPFQTAFHGGEVGIGWGRYFACDKYHVDLSLTYDVYYMHTFLSTTSDFFTNIISYSMHGFALGGRLDF